MIYPRTQLDKSFSQQLFIEVLRLRGYSCRQNVVPSGIYILVGGKKIQQINRSISKVMGNEGIAIFNMVVTKGLSDGVTFEQRPDKCEGCEGHQELPS